MSRFKPQKQGIKRAIFGEPGTGKSSQLIALSQVPEAGAIHYFDLEDTLAVIWPDVEAAGLDPFEKPMATPTDYMDFLMMYQGIKSGTAVIDTGSQLERIMAAPICKSAGVENVDLIDFKGISILEGAWRKFLDAMDQQARRGVNTVIAFHSTMASVKDEQGNQYNRIQPRVMMNNVGRPSPFETVTQRLDGIHLMSIDVVATKKVAKSNGVRTVYTNPMPSRCTKGRPAIEDTPLNGPFDTAFWKKVFGVKAEEEMI